MKKVNLILVPTDFTPVAKVAADQAVSVARRINGEIRLLHVVSKDAQVQDAKNKIDQIAAELQKESGIATSGMVRTGTIFEDIGEVAQETGARLIIMGTHGLKGMQHITGSYALRVITNSSVPFIVVQLDSNKKHFEKILMPIDLTKETKQKLNITVHLAKAFGSTVYALAPREDDEFLANTVKRNLAFAKNYLSDNQIPSEILIAEEKGNFTRQVLKYAEKIDADLIAIVSSADSVGFPDFFGAGSEQQILTNEMDIPVLCMNPAKVTLTGSVLFA